MEGINKTFAKCKGENRVCIPSPAEAMYTLYEVHEDNADLKCSLPLWLMLQPDILLLKRL